MFGTVLARLNSSPCRPLPSAAISRAERTKPLIRETTVPAAMTALEDRIFWSLIVGVPFPETRAERSSPFEWGASCALDPDPPDQPHRDGQEEQPDPDPQDQPDHLADLGGADRQRGGGAER